MPNYDLDQAYSINGPEDARKLYSSWADSYDSGFAEGLGYIAPRETARIFIEESQENQPILDVGAGTGLVAESMPGMTLDAIDITPEMLAEAEKKGLYRRRILGDLTQTLDIPDGVYGGIICCGTFTHGHVGPVCLPELLRVARPGALFVCGVNPSIYDGMGFGSALAVLVAKDLITPVRFREIRKYEGVDHPHKDDLGLVMVFHKV